MQIRILNSRTDDLNSAVAQFGLGLVHCEAGQYNGGLYCYLLIFWIHRGQLVADHVDVAQILNNILLDITIDRHAEQPP